MPMRHGRRTSQRTKTTLAEKARTGGDLKNIELEKKSNMWGAGQRTGGPARHRNRRQK